MTSVFVRLISIALASHCFAVLADAPREPVQAWIKVTPAVAVGSPGQSVTFTIDHGGLTALGTTPHVSVIGVPMSTGVMTHVTSAQTMLVTLALPTNAPRGNHSIKIYVGNVPPYLVSQEAVLDIRE